MNRSDMDILDTELNDTKLEPNDGFETESLTPIKTKEQPPDDISPVTSHIADNDVMDGGTTSNLTAV